MFGLYRQTQRSCLQPGLRVGGHLALTDFRSEDPKWIWLRAIDDSTINIVLCIIIFIFVIILLFIIIIIVGLYVCRFGGAVQWIS